MSIKTKFLDLFGRKRPVSIGMKGVGRAEARLLEQNLNPIFSFRRDEIKRPDGAITSKEISLEEIFKKKPSERREVIINHSPIVSKAASDYVKYTNPNWTFTTDYTAEDPENAPGMDIFRTFTERIEDYYGNWDHIFDSGSRSAFTHGAWFYELVIDADGRTPSDWRTLDPLTAVYRRSRREDTGADYFELGQYEEGFFGNVNKWISFADDPTVQYIPAQPNVTNPYGDQILAPAVTTAVMKTKFMRDFNGFLENLAQPSLVAKIITETFRDSHSGLDDQEFAQKQKELSTEIIEHVTTARGSKIYTFSDYVELEPLISGLNQSSIGSLKEVIDVLERDVIRACQSQPILMGRNEAVSETHATLQLIDYGTAIRKHSAPRARSITRSWNYILELNGLPPLAKFEFGFIIAEEFRKKADTYKLVQEALNLKEDGITKVLANIDTAIAMELLTPEEGANMLAEERTRRADDELQSGF